MRANVGIPRLTCMVGRDTYTNAVDLLAIGEAARRLGVSVETVRRWDRNGRISSVRTLGGQRRFTIAEIERLLSGAAA